MANFKLVKTEQKNITREFAEEFYSMRSYSKDRQLDPKRLRHLRSLFKESLIPFDWCIALVESTGQYVRVNGQHSSYLLSREIDPPTDAVAVMKHFVVKDESELDLLWASFDNAISSRNETDVFTAMLSETSICYVASRGQSKGKVVTKKIGVAMLKAIAEIYFGGTGSSHSTHVQKCELALANMHLIDWIAAITSLEKEKDVAKAGIAHAMLHTYCQNPNKALEFWTDILNERGESDSPTRFLEKEFHATSSIDSHDTNRKYNVRFQAKSSLEFAKLTVDGWDRYLGRKTRSNLRWFNLTSKPGSRAKVDLYKSEGTERPYTMRDIIDVPLIRSKIIVPRSLDGLGACHVSPNN